MTKLGIPGGWAYGVSMSRDGSLVACCSNADVCVWRTTGEVLWKRQTEHHVLKVTDFSPDSRVLMSAGRGPGPRLWDVASGTSIGYLSGPREPRATVVLDAKFSPDGNLIADAAQDGKIRLSDWESLRTVRTLDAHHRAALALAFSPESDILVSGGLDGALRCWDVSTGVCVATSDVGSGVSAVAFCPSRHEVAVGAHDGVVRFWNLAEFALSEVRLGGGRGGIRGVAYSPDGERLATAEEDRGVSVWQLASGAKISHLVRGQVSSVAWAGRCIAIGRDASVVVSDVA